MRAFKYRFIGLLRNTSGLFAKELCVPIKGHLFQSLASSLSFHQSLHSNLIVGSQSGNLPSPLTNLEAWLNLVSPKDQLFSDLEKVPCPLPKFGHRHELRQV